MRGSPLATKSVIDALKSEFPSGPVNLPPFASKVSSQGSAHFATNVTSLIIGYSSS